MKFGILALPAADGAILAHTIRANGVILKKGRRLGARELVLLATAGIEEVMAARLEPGDLPEDAVARAVAEALAGDGVVVAAAKTGRANLFAGVSGLWRPDAACIDAVNAVVEAITVATLPPEVPVAEAQMVATVKVIPFAVPRVLVERCIAVARTAAAGAPTSVTAFRPLRVGLLLTWLEGQPASRIEQASRAIAERIERLGSTLAGELRCHHDVASVSEGLRSLGHREVDLVLVMGASAIVDRQDVIPAAIVATGGRIVHFGMPVDPGNLILLGRCRAGGASYPVIGVPSCARSPKRSGFDMVLERVAAGLPVGGPEVQRMGVGGLLSEILSRPAARDARGEGERAETGAHVAALVLAAGSSRRMGDVNKLLIPIAEKPMVAHVVDRVRAVLSDVVIVTGHESQRVMAALGSRRVRHVHNPDHLEGLATSLKAGVAALAESAAGVLVCLGDMPWVRAETVSALVEAFDPEGGAHICVPLFEGKRGNPVLWGRRFFPEILALSGDTGAKEILARHADEVVAVEVDDPGILWDVDTEERARELIP